MSAVLRWKARSSQKAHILCHIFGHKWESGWWGNIPYLSINEGSAITDNIGRVHVNLTCLCDRCGKRTTVAKMHKPND